MTHQNSPQSTASESQQDVASNAPIHAVQDTAATRSVSTAAIIVEKLDEIENSLLDLRRWLGHRGKAGQRGQRTIDAIQRQLASLREIDLGRGDLANLAANENIESTGLPSNVAGIRENLFSSAHQSIPDWARFHWHRSRSGTADADLPTSSQAFCISTWGTAASKDGIGVRSALALVLKDDLLDSWLTGTEMGDFHLEFVDRLLLGEEGAGNPTNLDAVWEFPEVTLVVESKLLESFGPCTQVRGGHCSGVYGPGSDLKNHTDAACRLTVSDGARRPRRYWDVLEGIGYSPAAGQPCPFAGPGFQVMRVITAAAELARQRRTDWRVVFAYPETFAPEPGLTIDRVRELLPPEMQSRILTLDYEDLVGQLLAGDDVTAQELGSHLWRRLMAGWHHGQWSILAGVPAAKPQRKTKSRFIPPQYSRSRGRGFATGASSYISASPHVQAFMNPQSTQLALLIANRSGVRLRLEPGGEDAAALIREVVKICEDHPDLRVIQLPSSQQSATTTKISGPHPSVHDVPSTALEKAGFLPVRKAFEQMPF